MGVITTGTHPKELWPGIYKRWGTVYPEHELQCKSLFDWHDSQKAYEEIVENIGTGLAPAKAESAPATFSSTSQGVTNRATHVAYALGGIITYEALRDNLYESQGKRLIDALKFSMAQTKEIVFANAYNRAQNSSYTFGDGVEMISTAHPTVAGNQSNELSSNAQLSEVALEDICIQIMNAENSRGHNFKMRPKSLIVPTSEYFNARRILKSELQNDTAENAVNVLKYSGLFPDGPKENVYFSSTTAWFVRTNCPNGLFAFMREKLDLTKDNDFDTKNARFLAYERYSHTIGDWRAIYGSNGA